MTRADDTRYATVHYRIIHADGRVTEEHAIGLSQIAAYYPDARAVVRLDVGPPLTIEQAMAAAGVEGGFW